MAPRKLLVIGATGRQGGAVIDTLLNNHSDFEIYGLTRNRQSSSSKTLAARGVKMITGTPLDPKPAFESIGPDLWGVFAVTNRGKQEEEEGKGLIDAALVSKVQFFLLTSADRGGPEKSENNPTTVPHIISKHNIEHYLIAKAGVVSPNMRWTILRPVAFMDNLGPDMIGKVTARIMEQMNGKHLQMISTTDIGKVAAHVFNHAEQYEGRAITLAADRLSYADVNAIFRHTIGEDCPLAPALLLTVVKYAVDADIRKMAAWFNAGAYDGPLEPWPSDLPRPMDFRTWLKTSSRWSAQALE